MRKVESLQKVGLDPETVRGYNPRLIFCSITGYGRSGPYAGRGGYDLVAQGADAQHQVQDVTFENVVVLGAKLQTDSPNMKLGQQVEGVRFMQ